MERLTNLLIHLRIVNLVDRSPEIVDQHFRSVDQSEIRAQSEIGLQAETQTKMSKKNQHVVPHGGDWAVKREGGKRATVVVPTQKEAIEIGREISKNNGSELIIHRPDGRIRDKDSHGNDPYPPKG